LNDQRAIGTIKDLYRYPVKSMGGERLTEVSLAAGGIPGDRAWAVRDEKLGGIRGAKRFPALMRCTARYLSPPPASGSASAQVTFPDGSEMPINDDAMAEKLSQLLEAPVTVWPLMPADMLDHYRRGAPVLSDMEAELRRVFARSQDEPLPDLSGMPPELFEFESPPGTYFDAAPLLLMTTQSLAHLSSRASDHNFDIRRFRPNILIDAGSDGAFPERDWVGRTLRIGEARLEVIMDCPRCAMTTHGFDDLPRDVGIMRTLVAEAGGDLGVYARIVEPATIHSGDPIEIS
jgi:uncharacterized protein YcbX